MGLERSLLRGLTGLALSFGLSCGSDTGSYQSDEREVRGEDDEDEDDESTETVGADAGRRDAARPPSSSPQTPSTTRDAGSSSAPQENLCDEVQIQARPNAPDILIVLDRSSSMTGEGVDRWTPSANAVKQLTRELNEVVSFGLMLFPAPGAQAGVAQGILEGLGLGAINTFLPEDTGCAPGKVDVPIKLGNAMSIAQTLDRGGPRGVAYTPTATSLEAALRSLSTTCADCAEVPKYVLLVTDGQPTCTSGMPPGTQADIDATNVVIDKLRAADIKTYVIGYNVSQSAAAMNSFAEHGGTEKYLPVENGDQLMAELRRITGTLVSCEYELNEEVEDPALVRVVIDDETHILGDGWRIEGRKVILEGACEKIKDARIHRVQIKKDCEPQEIR